jgi:hypothetical protein
MHHTLKHANVPTRAAQVTEQDKSAVRQNSILPTDWRPGLRRSPAARRKPRRRRNGLKRKRNFKAPNKQIKTHRVSCRFSEPDPPLTPDS